MPVTNPPKLLMRLSCWSAMLPELSMTNRRSTLGHSAAAPPLPLPEPDRVPEARLPAPALDVPPAPVPVPVDSWASPAAEQARMQEAASASEQALIHLRYFIKLLLVGGIR